MQDKHIDKLREMLSHTMSLYADARDDEDVNEMRKWLDYGLELITTEQLAILERLIKSSNIEILRVKKPLFWGDDVYEYEVPAVPRYIIQAEIDKIGGKNG